MENTKVYVIEYPKGTAIIRAKNAKEAKRICKKMYEWLIKDMYISRTLECRFRAENDQK